MRGRTIMAGIPRFFNKALKSVTVERHAYQSILTFVSALFGAIRYMLYNTKFILGKSNTLNPELLENATNCIEINLPLFIQRDSLSKSGKPEEMRYLS